MKLNWRSGIALVIGGIVLGSMVSAVAVDDSGAPEKGVRRAHFIGGPGLIRSESVLEGVDGGEIRTHRADRGVLKAIDGTTLSIEEADGRTVDVPTDGDTTFARDRDEAKLADLKVGDHVTTMREKVGDGAFATKHVHAISEEQYQEMQERREACENDPDSCPRRMRMRGGPGRMLRDGDEEPAPAVAAFDEAAA
jgi:hypothetical protein